MVGFNKHLDHLENVFGISHFKLVEIGNIVLDSDHDSFYKSPHFIQIVLAS